MKNDAKLALPMDVARLLRCSPEHVCHLSDRGELRTLGRTCRGVRVFLLTDVEDYGARMASRSAVMTES